jgi:glutaredoxin 3
MPEVTIYSTAMCPYCMRAKKLLDNKGVQYHEIRVDNNPELWREMEQRSGRTTVPQIFIDDFHVGGFDDLSEMEMDDELDKRLGLD